ncbi:MAG: glycosyltransferase family 4 protein [Proteobacteria bacterium]|nr:glycosyltransferase family 4 protein [Pseudomonadota bacterium]MCP4915834.1 glycosyltransferase family 4 protein [Pseudomonadota bacterium]
MHVLHVSPYFPPTWAYGGIPRIVHGLTRSLSRQGVECSVWTTDACDARRARVPRDREHDGVRVLTSLNWSNRLAYDHQLFLPRDVPLDILDDVDIVHLHGHRHLLNNAAVAFAGRRNVPYVMTPNGTLHRHERKVGAKFVWDAVFSGRIPGGAQKLIAVSRAEAGRFVRDGYERVETIPNGLMLDEFEELPPRGEFRKRWGVEGRIVAYLGQISPRKGVDHLVTAFAGGGIPDATLVVGGNDMGGLGTARANASSGVVFTGLLEGAERLALLVDADVLVYPSTDEVFGLVPFEGLMCGTPVVVGGDCGCGELIRHAGAGLLVRHADVEGLRQRIRTLLDDRVAAQAMAKRGRAYVESELSFDTVARTHAALYEDVVRSWPR